MIMPEHANLSNNFQQNSLNTKLIAIVICKFNSIFSANFIKKYFFQ